MNIVVLVIVVVVVLILLYGFSTYNSLVALKNKVEEAFSTMSVYLKKRWDLIPNLVETVKGYAKHEQDTLEGVIKLRNLAYNEMSTEEKVEVNNKLSAGLSKIIALAEAYPDLKANTNFISLSNELTKIEEDIANSRKYYNGAVRNLNNKIEMFPSNIIAMIFGYKPRASFEIPDEEKENVKVSF